MRLNKNSSINLIIKWIVVFCINFTIFAGSFTITNSVDGKGIVLGTGTYESGAQISLKAVPQVDWKFDHWESVNNDQKYQNPLLIKANQGLQPQAIFLADKENGRVINATVVGWSSFSEPGNQPYGQIATAIPSGLDNIKLISAAGAVSYALKNDGSLVGWGSTNWNGLLNIPADLKNVKDISVANSHVTALRGDGTVVCWGYNAQGQCNVPIGLSNVVKVFAGGNGSFAIKRDGQLVGWGYNTAPTFGDPSGGEKYLGQSTTPAGLKDVESVALGLWHTVALKRDGSVVVWGSNYFGQTNVPPQLKGVVAVAAGESHSLALKSDGTVVSWGQWYDMRNYVQSAAPMGLEKAVAIAAVSGFSMILQENGKVVGWGRNNGQANVSEESPQLFDIAVGGVHGLGLKSDRIGVFRDTDPKYRIELGNPLSLFPRFASALTYQWFRDGKPIVGKTNSMLAIDSVRDADSGVYQVVAQNKTDAILSSPSVVQVVQNGSARTIVNGSEILESIKSGDQAEVVFQTSFANGQILYTTDGSSPSLSSEYYSGPFVITNSVLLRALAFSEDLTKQATNDAVSIQIVPTYTLSTSILGSGQIERTPSTARYMQDGVVEIKAVPSEGYRFARWEEDLSGAFPVRNIAMNRDKFARAVFEAIPRYTLTTTAKGGSVNGSGSYLQGSTVNLEATPAIGWGFLGWTGDYVGTDLSFGWTVESPATFVANFGTTISNVASGSGQIILDPALSLYAYGSEVRVIPMPSPGFALGLWGGAGAGQPKSEWILKVTNATPKITALFQALSPNKAVLTAQSTLGGRVTQSAVDGIYTKGTSVALTPVAEAGYEFTGWSGDASGSENPLTVVLDFSKTVKAGFRKVGVASYPVTVAITGPGTVRRVPDLGAYEAGSEVELVAEPIGGSLFVGWTGTVTNSQKRVRILVSAPVSVTAAFKAVYPVATEVRGEGQILLSPPDASYAEGTVVALTAKPADGWGFVQWLGDVVTTTQEVSLTVDAPKRVIAEFARLGTLTTKVVGSGTVSRTPEGQSFLPGTTVTLTAQAQAGWRFLRWSGGASGTNATIPVVVGRTEAIVAEFTDGEPPVLTVVQPVSGTVEDQRFSLSGTASDAVSLRGVRWAWNGISQGDLNLTAEGFSVGNLNLYMGTNLIEVTAEDAAGNASLVRREMVWKPIRTLIAGSAVEVQEGQRVTFPLSMVSTGDVGGLTFNLSYNPAFLTDPKVEWSAVVGQSVNTVNTSVAGEISGSFSLPGTALASGTAVLGTVDFRARSVPAQTNAVLNPVIVSVANSSGTLLATGNGAIAGEGRIRPRKIKGDNNANQRIDIGDAVVISRLLVSLEETRSWDVGLNDLNGSLSLDNGDVIKALRTVVGLDPQPSPGSEGKRLARALALAKALVNTNDAMAIELLDGPKATVGQPYRVAVRLNRMKGNLSGLSFALKYPTSLTLTDKQVGALVPGDALPFWNESAGQVSLAAIRSTAWASATGVAAVLTFVPSIMFSAQAEWPLKVEQVEITGSGFDVRPVDPVAVTVQSGSGSVYFPQVSLQPPKADGTMTLEILATQGSTVAVETTGDLNTWVETQRVTGQGNITPVKVSLQVDPNVQAKFWRVRVR
jgi:hypothetical protein